MGNEAVQLRPQTGPQEQFLSSPADIAIYGGQAGGGKTYALLMEAVRHIQVPGYGAVIFRKNSTQIDNEGGLWDTATGIYMGLGAISREYKKEFQFPPYNTTVSFRHLEHEKTVYDWQGAQIVVIGFDELTHFSMMQFFYMLSRNRSTCGVRPYIRATCNPDADSWVADFIAWWINQETGYPIPERAGVLRWMIRINDEIKWYDSREAANDDYPNIPPKSVTFIPASVHDNPALLEVDPGYLANLHALGLVERERLLGGNWKIRATGGTVFKKEWFEVVDDYPRKWKKRIRYWDFAATKPKPNKDPDYTVGTDMLIDDDDQVWIVDQVRERDNPGAIQRLVKNTASQDGKKVHIGIEEEPGSSGKFTSNTFVKLLIGFIVKIDKPTGSKAERAKPYASYTEHGNVKIVRGVWNKAFLDEHEAFPNPDVHDDTVDSASGGFKYLTEKPMSTTEILAKRAGK